MTIAISATIMLRNSQKCFTLAMPICLKQPCVQPSFRIIYRHAALVTLLGRLALPGAMLLALI